MHTKDDQKLKGQGKTSTQFSTENPNELLELYFNKMTPPFFEALQKELFHETASHPLVRSLMANNGWLPLGILNNSKMDIVMEFWEIEQVLKNNVRSTSKTIETHLYCPRDGSCAQTHTLINTGKLAVNSWKFCHSTEKQFLYLTLEGTSSMYLYPKMPGFHEEIFFYGVLLSFIEIFPLNYESSNFLFLVIFYYWNNIYQF